MDKPMVLIVEDDDAVARVLERLARRAGFLTAVDSSGKTAHVLARNLKPCCVLLDLALPGVDGRDILAELKADPQTQHIPVVVSSSNEEQQMRLSCLAAGADDYQVKPPSPVVFQRLARRFINDRPAS